ncbi:MAG: hypothetical protein WCO54_07270 [Bacteroidota bacterium]
MKTLLLFSLLFFANYFQSITASNYSSPIINTAYLSTAIVDNPKYRIVLGTIRDSGSVTIDELKNIESVSVEANVQQPKTDIQQVISFQFGYFPSKGNFVGMQATGSSLTPQMKIILADVKSGDKIIVAVKTKLTKEIISPLLLRVK